MDSILRRAIATIMLIMLAIGSASCDSDRDVPVVLLPDDTTETTANRLVGAIAEVSPPERIQQLKPYLDVYAPQVRIANPDPDTTLTSATVQVEVQVRDFPIYKDQSFGFGPHLHLFLDDLPHQAIYDADAPITLENLSPGTHILRLVAVRPWGESFKNEGAYDQVTFNVFAASPQNNPDDSQPILTYNLPQDSYGAEPILLDFHLNNAPPHLVAQADETITDWRIRCTINGESFVFDRWQPIYLKGFQPGKNWLKLELIDENGNLIDNALNTTVRVIDYQPGGSDGLSQLVRGEIPLAQAKVLIDPSYEPPTLQLEDATELSTPETGVPDSSTNNDDQETALPLGDDELPPSVSTTAPEAPETGDIEKKLEASEADTVTESAPVVLPEAIDDIDAATPSESAQEDVEEETTENIPTADDPAEPTSEVSPADAIDMESVNAEVMVEDQSSQQNTDIQSTIPDQLSLDETSAVTENAADDGSALPENVAERKSLINSEGSPESVTESSEGKASMAPSVSPNTDDEHLINQDTTPAQSTDSLEASRSDNNPDAAAAETDFPNDNEPSDQTENVDLPSGNTSPDTDLKTLEDNADLI